MRHGPARELRKHCLLLNGILPPSGRKKSNTDFSALNFCRFHFLMRFRQLSPDVDEQKSSSESYQRECMGGVWDCSAVQHIDSKRRFGTVSLGWQSGDSRGFPVAGVGGGVCQQSSRKAHQANHTCVWKFPTEASRPRTRPEMR